MKRVIGAVGHVVARVVAPRLSHVDEQRRPALRARYLLGTWSALVDDRFAILRQWSAPSPITFEQHIADAVGSGLDGLDGLDGLEMMPGLLPPASEWTPSMVGAALDDGDRLRRQLARYIDQHLRACAIRTLQSHRRKADVAAEAQDLAQEFLIKLFEKDGAVLRGWQPDRGRTTLRSYLSFIGQRHFLHRLRREQAKGGKVVPIDGGHQEIPAPTDRDEQFADELRRDLAFQAMRAQLDADERELLALALKGTSAKEGGEALGITSNNFHQRKHRLMKKMKAIWSSFGGHHEE